MSAYRDNPFWSVETRSPKCTGHFSSQRHSVDYTSGKQSLALHYQGGVCTDYQFYAYASLPKDILAGKKIRVTGDLKNQKGAAGFIALVANKEDGGSESKNTVETNDPESNEWQHVGFDIHVPKNSLNILLVVGLTLKDPTLEAQSASSFFDNIGIEITGTKEKFSGTTDLQKLLPTFDQLTSLNRKLLVNANDEATVAKIAQSLSSSNIVGLGEATHGTKEFQLSKIALIKKLVQSHGYRAVAFEEGFASASDVNDYVTLKTQDLDLAKTFEITWWKTREVADLIAWMRDYNLEHSDDPVFFSGFDISAFYPLKSISKLKAFVTEHYKDEETVSDLDAVMTLAAKGDYQLALEKIEKIREWLDSHEKDFSEDKSYLWQMASQILTTLKQGTDRNLGGYATRDSHMARNVSWIRDFFKRDKIILWAHNAHVSKIAPNMGSLLAEKYEENYTSLGYLFYQGNFTIFSYSTSGLDQIEFLPASAVSLEASFQSAGDYLSSYLNTENVDWKTFHWLNNRLYRTSGATGGKVYEPLPLPEMFDHLIYFKTSTPIEIMH
jgi:erythromycin esterase